MSERTGIQWTDATWNPTTGCDQVSEGCDHCYAKTLAGRLWARQYPPNEDGSTRRFEDVRLHPDRLALPLRWKSPKFVFVDSMSDLFHDAVPDEFIAQVFAVMYQAHRHVFQVLTKRPGRMASLVGRDEFIEQVQAACEATHEDQEEMYVQLEPWPPRNVWLGTSVENQKWADVRIRKLLQAPAAVRFLSCEPLLGPISLTQAMGGQLDVLAGDRIDPRDASVIAGGARVDWVIVGGESGPGARPMHPEWARSLRDQCTAAGIPMFFKQWGSWRPFREGDPPAAGQLWDADGSAPLASLVHAGVGPKSGGRELDGRTWDEMPAAADVDLLVL